MTYWQLLPVFEQYLPSFAKLLGRIASPQIRNLGTIGGNIANASPIGDMPPILLALDTSIHIRHCAPHHTHSDDKQDSQHDIHSQDDIIPLSDFFISYKHTKLQAGSYIAAVHIPLLTDKQHLIIHKISKRYEDDISACLLALRVDVEHNEQTIADARIGLGGMAAIPTLAVQTQNHLIDSPLTI